MSQLQTLDRGLHALRIIARHPGGLSIAELAEALGINRAIVYRIVATLEANALAYRREDGAICLGGGILGLAAQFEPQLRSVAEPLLRRLARETNATAYLSAAQGDECVALMVAEPEEALLRVGYRVGSRHPLTIGAAGIAILSARPESESDSDAVRDARRQGYSITRGQLQRGAVGVACPLCDPASRPGFEGSVGVVALDDLNADAAASAVQACVKRLNGLLA
ncbi:IclR family transcriptional regulator [Modicisalibacter tunisiensis]|uniref:HTH-type transcriptional repressor AllR n=1 Tax=Modicisalibacter tunisiensis TaxID=390637 RepID=A0ABS7WWT1_9GAMM|nr:helix-turn-helix domain-containing protein [Modicisalibacter tunisiensis]MBZ9566624.1 helix-turn-helix domain-containing protein [Modicisalibacter tunisiensis]